MSSLTRIKNRNIAKLTTRFTSLSRKFTGRFETVNMQGIPWSPLQKPLKGCKVAIVTTAGVHHRDQPSFDMLDREGDPTFRAIDTSGAVSDLVITHDYYDHRDADKDINVVFPIDRLRELEKEGMIGSVATKYYGFMGHILGRHVHRLINGSAPEVAKRLAGDGVDIVLLTPG